MDMADLPLPLPDYDVELGHEDVDVRTLLLGSCYLRAALLRMWNKGLRARGLLKIMLWPCRFMEGPFFRTQILVES